jgi:hypothetical protein
MSEWREPTEAEIEDALARVPGLSRDPALARERAVRFARAEAWQRDRGLAPAVGEQSREGFARAVHWRFNAFRQVGVKPPDGVTYGRGKAGPS